MAAFLLGLLVLVLVLFALNAFANANPASLVRMARAAGGVALLMFALFLGLRGQWVLALPVAVFALSLFGVRVPYRGGFGARVHRSPGQASTVRGGWVEMTLDHDTGAMTGTVLRGEHAGRALDELSEAELLDLRARADADSVALVDAYLDRRSPGWRDHGEADPGGGHGERGPVQGPMTQEEAYEVLGLAPGAGEEEIRRAHRALMKRLHPDRGGSTYLAAKVNEAKDLLLNAHHTNS